FLLRTVPFSLCPPPQRSRLFPYTTLFRSGTGLNAEPRYIKNVVGYLADISGLPLVSAEHLVDATQNIDAYAEVSSALKISMMNRSEEHTSELQSRENLVCRLLLEKKY